jgi:hypothetical protein
MSLLVLRIYSTAKHDPRSPPDWVSIDCNIVQNHTRTFAGHAHGPSERRINTTEQYEIYASTEDKASPVPNARNCMKMIASSTMVPSEPISQGRLVRKYSFSVEWNKMPAP